MRGIRSAQSAAPRPVPSIHADLVSHRRRLARERQRRKRLRESGGVGIVPVRTHLGTLYELLREGEFLDDDSNDHPATLARGLERLIETLRDARDVTSANPCLRYRQGTCKEILG
jgi:hypothetical protein